MPALTGTLDTSVNGPGGLPPFDGDAWDHVDWRRHEEQVRRLRGRIFKAVQGGDWPLARNLQKLMLRSWSNTLVACRQVTQRNTGRKTNTFSALDLRISREFKLGKSVALEPIVEVFNVFNSANILVPQTTNLIFNFDGTVQSGNGDPRQVQVGLRFIF